MTNPAPADAPAVPPASLRAIYGGALVTTLVVLALDQLTKWWALEDLDNGRTIDLVWTLRFRLTFNTGFAFSTGEGFGWIIGLAAVAISVVLVLWMRRLPTATSRIGAGLVLGGAIGNLIDRLFRADDGFMSGGVVDFIDLQWWPVFNIADSAICIGVVWLLIVLGRLPPDPAPETSAEPDPAPGDDEASASPRDQE